jgi:hypothetical protein
MIRAAGASCKSLSSAEMIAAAQVLEDANGDADVDGSSSCAAQEAKSAKLLLSLLGLLLEPEAALISESVEPLRSTMAGGGGGRDGRRMGACGREEKACTGGATRWFMGVAVLK